MDQHIHNEHKTSTALSAGKHAGHHTEDFLTKFVIVLVLAAPMFALSGVPFAPLILGSIVFWYGGLVFIRGAWRELQGAFPAFAKASAGKPGMMTLISLAISAAYAWSVYATFAGGEALWWELASLIAIMLLGHYIEMKAVQSAQGALTELSALLPDEAKHLKSGDTVVVKPGAKMPGDGVVTEGVSEVDESILTGESRPVPKRTGDTVIAGSINGDGSLTVRVTKTGEATFLAGVMRLVREAEASKSRLQILSDKAALWLTVIAVTAGAVTFTAWLVTGSGIATAVERLVAVLVVACPHALGLAVPLVAAISTTMAARNGFLVKRRLALEAARAVDTVLFDKTGTLTEGKFSVTAVTSDDVLALAAAVDAHSEHPIGRAIVEEVRKRALSYKEVKDFKRIPGIGAEGVVDGKKVFVGHRGGADIIVELNGKKIGTIVVTDTPRREAKEAVDALKHLGIKVVMITGDSAEVARDVAGTLGISEYFARVLPHEKVEKVTWLQKNGAKVAMVGDGVNDAPALTQADLGVAIGAGTTVAVESAGIILVRNDPRDIPKIIALSRATYRKMLQNLFWATGYNVVALPLAAGALAFKGILLTPALAAVFMSLSTIIVAVNAMLLRKKSL